MSLYKDDFQGGGLAQKTSGRGGGGLLASLERKKKASVTSPPRKKGQSAEHSARKERGGGNHSADEKTPKKGPWKAEKKKFRKGRRTVGEHTKKMKFLSGKKAQKASPAMERGMAT